MTDTIRSLLSSMGSVLDIYPKSNYSRYVPAESAYEMIKRSFEEVGTSLYKAMNEIGPYGKEATYPQPEQQQRAINSDHSEHRQQ